MDVSNDHVFRGFLVTKGRKTGKEHRVMLRGVCYNGKFYFSRHAADSDWFQNALVNSDVIIEYDSKSIKGKARQVMDMELERKISLLKYPGEKRAKERRVVIEITLYEQ